ncbi:hypothetical protein BDN72DRAFT_150510 [Pluteus cervinus]|uniref:Uncharacterized protein n=1 Tax=Pluteus cervinus TaxID=181527 RepID=A0ACD3B7V9_9AGAR|nr:hypothetical protein BDN72DRAFT_150510 [Pluteus cervinus]
MNDACLVISLSVTGFTWLNLRIDVLVFLKGSASPHFWDVAWKLYDLPEKLKWSGCRHHLFIPLPHLHPKHGSSAPTKVLSMASTSSSSSESSPYEFPADIPVEELLARLEKLIDPQALQASLDHWDLNQILEAPPAPPTTSFDDFFAPIDAATTELNRRQLEEWFGGQPAVDPNANYFDTAAEYTEFPSNGMEGNIIEHPDFSDVDLDELQKVIAVDEVARRLKVMQMTAAMPPDTPAGEYTFPPDVVAHAANYVFAKAAKQNSRL